MSARLLLLFEGFGLDVDIFLKVINHSGLVKFVILETLFP